MSAVPGRRADYGSGVAPQRVKPGESVVVRVGGPPDRAFVADLGKRTAEDSVAAFRRFNRSLVEVSYEGLLDFFYAQEHIVYVAEIEGRRVGFLLLLTSLPDEVTRMPQGFVAYMAVEPSMRRYGIGDRLLAAAEEESRRRGLPYMGLMVTEDNDAARALYERAGYVTERRLLCKPL